MGLNYICPGCTNERGCDILGECFSKRVGHEATEKISTHRMVRMLSEKSPSGKVTKKDVVNYYGKRALKKYRSVPKKKPTAPQQKNVHPLDPYPEKTMFLSWAFNNGWDYTGGGFYTDGVTVLNENKLRKRYRKTL